MSNYDSENTTILATHEQAGGNTRMLLLHKCGSGRLEYVIGSYFTVMAKMPEGLVDESGVLYDRETMKVIDNDSIEAGRLCADAWRKTWPHLIKCYSWDWGHYFNDFASAADYWKREVLGEPEPAKSPDSIEVECKFGTLVCSVFSDNDDYRELAIDLVRPDGRSYQVCCVGTDEHEPWSFDWLTKEKNEQHRRENRSVHVYVWNGEDEDCCDQFYMDPNGDGHWN